MGLFSSSKSSTENKQITNTKTVNKTNIQGFRGKDAVALASVIAKAGIQARQITADQSVALASASRALPGVGSNVTTTPGGSSGILGSTSNAILIVGGLFSLALLLGLKR